MVEQNRLIELSGLIVEKKATMSKCEKMFGDYLFGEFTSFYKSEKEGNTPTEEDLFQVIWKFISGDYMEGSVDKALYNAFKQLQNCMSEFPMVLKPDTNVLYRGTTLNKHTPFVGSKYGLGDDAILKSLKKWNGSDAFISVKGGTYKPRQSVQSWTAKEHIAVDFAKTNIMGKGIITAYFKAKIPKGDLLFNTKFMNSFDYTEHEIIRLGTNVIKCSNVYLGAHGVIENWLGLDWGNVWHIHPAWFSNKSDFKISVGDITVGGWHSIINCLASKPMGYKKSDISKQVKKVGGDYVFTNCSNEFINDIKFICKLAMNAT